MKIDLNLSKASSTFSESESSFSSSSFSSSSDFLWRHIGPRPDEIDSMLHKLGFNSLETFLEETLPAEIRSQTSLRLPPAASETETLQALWQMMSKNRIVKSHIGMGYTASILPSIIRRSVLENPGWYTPYTPYQSEISQGRLEVLFYFQTMICDLTGMKLSNASLLDEGTAVAEAMNMARSLQGGKERNRFLIANDCHPQTEAVLQTRANAIGIKLSKFKFNNFTNFKNNFKNDFTNFIKDTPIASDTFAVLFQMPDTNGAVFDLEPVISEVHKKGALAIVATALLPLTLLKSPGECGADVVIGTTQPFGIPLGYGGPHAAFFATRDEFKRKIPGRLVGVSKDSQGKRAFRLTLQTREQHIRREKATSNLCTSQVLLANMAALFAMYHGPEGLKKIATNIHQKAHWLENMLMKMGYSMRHKCFFDTLLIELSPDQKRDILSQSEKMNVEFRSEDVDGIGITIDETTSLKDLENIVEIFDRSSSSSSSQSSSRSSSSSQSSDRSSSFYNYVKEKVASIAVDFSENLFRRSAFLTDDAFNKYHSETELLRFIKRQEARDLSLTNSMIPLGSCTMKLNAAMEMQALCWKNVASLHPFCPANQAKGYSELMHSLEKRLASITGLDAVSLQPNAGSQGEFAGLLAIRAYHQSRSSQRYESRSRSEFEFEFENRSESESSYGYENRSESEFERNLCLIPRSAHGTNPASAKMAGFKVMAVDCDDRGNTDIDHLRQLAIENRSHLGALMITYPSTHGVFEEGIVEMIRIIHENGGQVYLDGANLNAQVGLCSLGELGVDVCHMNLHKTFCVPHGGGGPGVGPIAVRKHLIPFLPGHPFDNFDNFKKGSRPVGPVASAPFGSASLLTIAWAYLNSMGAEGLTKASAVAILNANYIAKRLERYFPILYKGASGRVAHECILDLRSFKRIGVEDVAKRLMDYGFHAPTISWPVAGTMMIEPTESEPLSELDRFCEAMISIHREIEKVENGEIDPIDNPLKNAPHTALMIASEWGHPYSRMEAAFPLPHLLEHKFWPSVGRVDNVFGDRNPLCSCDAEWRHLNI